MTNTSPFQEPSNSIASMPLIFLSYPSLFFFCFWKDANECRLTHDIYEAPLLVTQIIWGTKYSQPMEKTGVVCPMSASGKIITLDSFQLSSHHLLLSVFLTAIIMSQWSFHILHLSLSLSAKVPLSAMVILINYRCRHVPVPASLRWQPWSDPSSRSSLSVEGLRK